MNSHLCYVGGRTGYTFVHYRMEACTCRYCGKSIPVHMSDNSKLRYSNIVIDGGIPVIRYTTIYTMYYYLRVGYVRLVAFDWGK